MQRWLVAFRVQQLQQLLPLLLPLPLPLLLLLAMPTWPAQLNIPPRLSPLSPPVGLSLQRGTW
jgi:hypothetical protein